LLDFPTVAAESRHSAISAADFFIPAHSLIWQAIERVGAAGTPVGVVTVAHELAAMGEIDRLDALLRPDTPEGYMVGLWADSWAATGASAWARMIHEYAERRRAIARGSAIVRDAHRGPVVEEQAIYDRDEYKGLEF
jgi:replicative DNA helicase